MKSLTHFFHNRKYEFLFIGLVQHVFLALFISDINFYHDYLWPFSLMVLTLFCFEVFYETGTSKKHLYVLITLGVCLLPIIGYFNGFQQDFMQFACLVYVIFFAIVFAQLMRYLLRPNFRKTDIISASFCGYLLLLEIMTFCLMFFYYNNPSSLIGIDYTDPVKGYIDLVYFSAVTLTTTVFGDVIPNSPQLKLLVALFSLVGQFYSVVLIGILITKFTRSSLK